MRCTTVALAVLLSLLGFAGTAVAAPEPSGQPLSRGRCPSLDARSQRVLSDALHAERIETGTPGVSAAIADRGCIIWTAQDGVKELAMGAPVLPDTLFSLASVSKLFTAAMVMRLVENGRLHLDDRLSEFVPPDMPDAGRVTVAELLAHTSGYPDAEGEPWMLQRLDDPDYAWTREAVIDRQQAVRSPPGLRFSYCNSCYVILGAPIERAARSPVGSYLRRSILAPLRLDADVDIDRSAAYAPRVADGYDLRGHELVDVNADAQDLGVATSVWGPVWTDGGVVATAAGVARFTDALFAGRVVSAASLRWMLQPARPGVVVESNTFDHRSWRGHSGYYNGYTAETWYDARRRLTITVLANRSDDADPATEIWNRLAAAYDRSVR